MYIIDNYIPPFIIKKQNITSTVLFTAIFALSFINFYAPFGVNIWFHLTKLQLFFYSSLVILTGMLVIALSRIILYQYGKRRKISYFSFAIWLLAEILSMSAFYTLFGKYFLKDSRGFLSIFQLSIKNTALILLLPYSILWMYFSWREKIKQLEDISKGENEQEKHGKKMLPFKDEKGTLRFSILIEDFLYMEAADNYVTIYYDDNNKISKFLIRNALKNIENELNNKSLVRCHRSYIVNFDRVKIIRKEKEGLLIDLNVDPTISLPVSKTYVPNVINGFSGSLN